MNHKVSLHQNLFTFRHYDIKCFWLMNVEPCFDLFYVMTYYDEEDVDVLAEKHANLIFFDYYDGRKVLIGVYLIFNDLAEEYLKNYEYTMTIKCIFGQGRGYQGETCIGTYFEDYFDVNTYAHVLDTYERKRNYIG